MGKQAKQMAGRFAAFSWRDELNIVGGETWM